MRCTLCPVHELTRETEEIDCGKCDSYTRCCRNFATTHTVGVAEILQSLIHRMYQKFCGHLYIGRRRNSVSTLTLDIAEICDHSYTGCGRNSATFYTMDVAEILQRFIHWVLQKFCDQSYTGCCRNSAITQTLSLAENLRLFKHWMSQKFCNTHRLDVKEIPRKNTTWQYDTFEVALELLPNKSQNKEKEIEIKNVYKAILRAPSGSTLN